MNLHIDSMNSGRYSDRAAAKSVAGLRIPESNVAHNRASGFFVRNALARLSMVAQAGAPSGAPASTLTGNANSVWATTNRGFASAGGSENAINVEAAIMATIPTLAQPEIILTNGRAVTSSLAVAAYFSKRHDNIIQKIQTLECSSEFTALNFKASDYIDSSGRTLPCYEITRSGFMFLVMGFTGKKAAHLKESYINAFDAMEAKLSSPALSGNYQIVLTFENNVMVDSRPVRSDEYTCSLATFFEMAERQGYLVIHADDLKSLSFGHRRDS
ncbi:TPA: Rha family transcriptional regulator [Klebsiella aerogenes]